MKNILFIITLTAITFSCKETQKSEQIVNEKIETSQQIKNSTLPKTENASEKSWMNEISLNNGSKWEANPETTEGIENMIQAIDQNKLKAVTDFQELGIKLNNEKNYIVEKCTMEGPSHDNLHVFLYPLINKIKDLMTVNSVTEGSKITTNIQAHLEGYNLYFH
ncbi:hypothetical protein [Marixanthomonas ophiurae]|uniref:Uncharacterized protein n=1 Tax=Marixanthomonas ophiurae TaxID=387659 RepID=A0A3E1QDN4_9FLAO|nr:hypothetical protein [Marixanthomonas ophiurae]RFN60253.1 hypothetical protein DZ858_09490 [Marixanthomonas ophiurae]